MQLLLPIYGGHLGSILASWLHFEQLIRFVNLHSKEICKPYQFSSVVQHYPIKPEELGRGGLEGDLQTLSVVPKHRGGTIVPKRHGGTIVPKRRGGTIVPKGKFLNTS